MTRFGPAEEHALRPHGRGELPLGRRRRRWRPDRGRRGDHAGGRAGWPQRRRSQRAGLPPRGSLAGAPAGGARLLCAVADPAAQPHEDPRDRSRDLPATIGGPGGRDPAGRSHVGARPYPLPASAGSALLAASGNAAWLLALVPAAAVAIWPAVASPPPLIAALACLVVFHPRRVHAAGPRQSLTRRVDPVCAPPFSHPAAADYRNWVDVPLVPL